MVGISTPKDFLISKGLLPEGTSNLSFDQVVKYMELYDAHRSEWGTKCKFKHLQNVTITISGNEYYGWINEIKFPDTDCPLYQVYLITGWKGEPFKSEEKGTYLEWIDEEDQDIVIAATDKKW